MIAEKLKELQELLEAHQMMYDTEGYVSTNTADFLIKTAMELAEQLAAHQQVKEIEVYDNGVAKIIYADGDRMLVNDVCHRDAILTGWDEEDCCKKG